MCNGCESVGLGLRPLMLGSVFVWYMWLYKGVTFVFFYCPSLSSSLLTGLWDVAYVSVVLFCYILDVMLCYVWKKKCWYQKKQRSSTSNCKSHHLQCITSAKVSEKLEKSLCVRARRPLLDARGLRATDAVSSGLKRRETSSMLSVFRSKASISDVWGCISAYGMGSLHVLEGTMNAERYIKVLEQHMLSSRWRVFQQGNAKPHTAAITTAWLRSRRVRVLNWPACSPDLSRIENIWCIIKRKIRLKPDSDGNCFS